MRRILSIWLPQLPLDRRARLGDPRLAGPFAVIAESGNAWRLSHVNPAARLAGAMPGQSLTDARAVCPDLLSEPADPLREEVLLRALRRWADALSPLVAIDAPDGLLLDISGCAQLFGGEVAMAADARERLQDLQLSARIGIADSRGAARALARFAAEPVTIAAAGETAAALAELPVAALGIDAEQSERLARVGLRTVAQLTAIRSRELARRFGPELGRSLGMALGQEADTLDVEPLEPRFAARMAVPEPIAYRSDVEAVLLRLANSVCRRLERRGKGARQFRLIVAAVDSGARELTVGFARPGADPAAVLKQFAPALDELRLEFGADGFRLIAEQVETMPLQQLALDGSVTTAPDIAEILTTLGNRLGFERICRFEPAASHLPQREFVRIEASGGRPVRPWQAGQRRRPLRMFDPPERLRVLNAGRPPERFKWRNTLYATASSAGPERLAAEWWRDEEPVLRDYWVVQTEDGATLWLLNYPDRDEDDWYVAGRFP